MVKNGIYLFIHRCLLFVAIECKKGGISSEGGCELLCLFYVFLADRWQSLEHIVRSGTEMTVKE